RCLRPRLRGGAGCFGLSALAVRRRPRKNGFLHRLAPSSSPHRGWREHATLAKRSWERDYAMFKALHCRLECRRAHPAVSPPGGPWRQFVPEFSSRVRTLGTFLNTSEHCAPCPHPLLPCEGGGLRRCRARSPRPPAFPASPGSLSRACRGRGSRTIRIIVALL